MIERPEYKQQIYNADYTSNLIPLKMTPSEWGWAETWVNVASNKKFERLDDEWFKDLYHMYMVPIRDDIYFSGKKFEEDEELEYEIPRQLIRMFVYSIGQIAYDIDMKGQVCIIAQGMLNKIHRQLEEQLNPNDQWFKWNF